MNKILNGILDNFKKDFSLQDLQNSKSFEYLVNYLLVSKLHPDGINDKGDLEQLCVDDKSQFGLDGIAFIINDNLIFSKEDIEVYAKSKRLEVKILFIQAKTEEKCDTGDLLKTIRAAKNFINNFDAITEKNDNIINAREIYDELFEYHNSKLMPGDYPQCFIYYATAAKDWDRKLVQDICEAEQNDFYKINSDIKLFSINVLGSEYLISAYNEIMNSVDVQIYFKNALELDCINGVKKSYIGYLSGEEYLKIIVDQNGELRKRIFYENVRDYQGQKNPVNTEIRNTISTAGLQDKFVLLNNGVTIITKSLKPLGGNNYELRDFQIVNGCQTSNEIFNQKEMANKIHVPVKLIHTIESDIITMIVKATNRQSPVPEEAFYALSQYHKELQELFKQYSKEMPIEIYYERRPGELANEKLLKYQKFTLHGLIRTITSVYFLESYIVYNNNPANILKNRKERLFKKDHPQEIYYISSLLLAFYNKFQTEKKLEDKDSSKRFYIIMIVRCLMTKTIKVSEFSSKESKKEIENVLQILKSPMLSSYYITAQKIVNNVYKQYEKKHIQYSEKKRLNTILKSQDFNREVLQETQKYIEIEKNQKKKRK